VLDFREDGGFMLHHLLGLGDLGEDTGTSGRRERVSYHRALSGALKARKAASDKALAAG